jgi:hypothetical protein
MDVMLLILWVAGKGEERPNIPANLDRLIKSGLECTSLKGYRLLIP